MTTLENKAHSLNVYWLHSKYNEYKRFILTVSTAHTLTHETYGNVINAKIGAF